MLAETQRDSVLDLSDSHDTLPWTNQDPTPTPYALMETLPWTKGALSCELTAMATMNQPLMALPPNYTMYAPMGGGGHRYRVIGCHWTSLCVVGRHWTSLDIAGHHWTPLGVIGRCWTSLDTDVIGCHLTLLGILGH